LPVAAAAAVKGDLGLGFQTDLNHLLYWAPAQTTPSSPGTVIRTVAPVSAMNLVARKRHNKAGGIRKP
jgi:hypothetical protein